MYENLKILLDAAEKIGTVETVDLSKRCVYTPNRVKIKGVTADGEKFELELEVGECEVRAE